MLICRLYIPFCALYSDASTMVTLLLALRAFTEATLAEKHHDCTAERE